MDKNKNNKLPKIMLPVAMVVASLVGSMPTTLTNIVYPILVSSLGMELPANGLAISSNVMSVLGGIGHVVVLILFSLTCKGLYKKLWFIMSAYVGSITGVFVSACSLITSLLFTIFRSFMDVYIQTMVYGLVSSVVGIINIALEIVVASFFFNAMLKFTEKEISEENDIAPYKVNMVVPGIAITVCGVVMTVMSIVCSFLGDLISVKFCTDTWEQFSVINALNVVLHIVIWVAIIGASFLFKEKYKKLTFVGSVVAGRYIWGFLSGIQSIIVSIFPMTEGVLTVLWGIIYMIFGIASGILIFYIANKRQYERIKK